MRTTLKYRISIIVLFVFLQEEIAYCQMDIKYSTVRLELLDEGQYFTIGTGIIFQSQTKSSDFGIITCSSMPFKHKVYMSVEVENDLLDKLNEVKANAIMLGNSSWVLTGKLLRGCIDLKEDSNFFRHPHLDLAYIGIQFGQSLRFGDSSIKAVKIHSFTDSSFLKDNLKLSDQVISIGYPMQIGSNDGLTLSLNEDEYFINGQYSDSLINPVYRKGIISFLDSDFFLIEAMTFFEDKGSPVLRLKQSGTKAINDIIGMVVSPVGSYPYSERIEERNVGLTKCLYINDILAFLNYCKTKEK